MSQYERRKKFGSTLKAEALIIAAEGAGLQRGVDRLDASSRNMIATANRSCRPSICSCAYSGSDYN